MLTIHPIWKRTGWQLQPAIGQNKNPRRFGVENSLVSVKIARLRTNRGEFTPAFRCTYSPKSTGIPPQTTIVTGLKVSAEALVVEKRETTGTLRIRRMRNEGKIPAVLYGHGQECIMLAIDSRAVSKMVDHGHYIVSLSGAVSDTAMIKDVQWDAFGSNILHIDLARVDASEAIEVSLPLHVKGEAPGANMGGMVSQLAHELKISCPATALPDFLEANIDDLQLDGSITASDIELPPGASLVGNPAETLISCSEPRGASSSDEAAEGDGEAAEPEVIGKSEEGEEKAAE